LPQEVCGNGGGGKGGGKDESQATNLQDEA